MARGGQPDCVTWSKAVSHLGPNSLKCNVSQARPCLSRRLLGASVKHRHLEPRAQSACSEGTDARRLLFSVGQEPGGRRMTGGECHQDWGPDGATMRKGTGARTPGNREVPTGLLLQTSSMAASQEKHPSPQQSRGRDTQV